MFGPWNGGSVSTIERIFAAIKWEEAIKSWTHIASENEQLFAAGPRYEHHCQHRGVVTKIAMKTELILAQKVKKMLLVMLCFLFCLTLFCCEESFRIYFNLQCRFFVSSNCNMNECFQSVSYILMIMSIEYESVQWNNS